MSLTKAEIERRARELLESNDLRTIPVDPVVLAQRMNIKINNAVFSDENLAAMISKRGDQVTILVKRSDPPFRKRFSIAHELGHYLFHLREDGEIADREADLFRVVDIEEETGVGTRGREVEANRFAAALLMDAELVRREWENLRSVRAMSRLFNVSEGAMGIRVGALGLE